MSQDTTLSSQRGRPLFRVVKKEEEHLFFTVKLKDGRWSKEEHKIFLEAILDVGIRNWKRVSNY
jgi:hypothetical protein